MPENSSSIAGNGHDTMFQGRNIFDRLSSSSFGAFCKVMSNLEGLKMDEFNLPEVVVIGGESSGKSSLLEAVTKCPVFPRDTDLSTRMPVRLELKNADGSQEEITITFGSVKYVLDNTDGVLAKVQEIMDSLPPGEIVEDELKIQICKPNIPTFTLMDLPGIRTNPEKLKRVTNKIVDKYLSRSNTLVIAVLPASTPRLGSDLAMGKVDEHKKASQTVVALTMADLAKGTAWDTLMDRIRSGSKELAGLNLVGCVAVVNRTHDSDYTLLQVDQGEGPWFASRIAPDELELIKDNITVASVVARMDRLYHAYICKTWKPTALSQIKELQKNTQTKLEPMGLAPGKVNADDLRKELANQLKKTWLALPAILDTELSLAPERLPGVEWRTREWAVCLRDMQSWYLKWITKLESGNFLKQDIETLLSKAFNTESFLKTERFEIVWTALVRVGESIRQACLRRIGKKISMELDTTVSCLYLQATDWAREIHILNEKIRGIILVDVVLEVCLESVKKVSICEPITENREYSNRRAKLLGMVEKQKLALRVVADIENRLAQ
jgi:GTP-binding protein EngB required for normal cell division